MIVKMVRSMLKTVLASTLAAALALALTAPAALAMDRGEADLKVRQAKVILDRIMKQSDKSIPKDLLRQAKAVGIFPGMFKAGFVVGGQYGTGMICVRQADGKFGPPAFFEMGGASVGFQIGAQSTDLVLVVMQQRGLDGILKNQVKFGADVAVAAGPVGRRGEAALSGASGHADVYSYSLTKGLFAGVSLEGAGIGVDENTNAAYYGGGISPRGIMVEGQAAMPPASAQELIKALNKYSR
jgi:lipid-binding SYLF domain-containing protein